MTVSAKLLKDLEDIAVMIDAIRWETFSPEGHCIPISYAVNEFLVLRKRPSRVAETALMARDPLNKRFMEIKASETFTGHVVVLMPAQGLLLDGSLWSQESKVLANFAIPKLVVMPWKKEVGAMGHIDRLELFYVPNLRTNEWRKRDWPFTEIKEAVIFIENAIRKGDF